MPRTVGVGASPDGRSPPLGHPLATPFRHDGRARRLAPNVEAMFPREITMKNFVYTRGKEDGIRETLLHQVTRRLGREPSAAERTALTRHLATREGAERLGDAVLDLDAAAFARWILSGSA